MMVWPPARYFAGRLREMGIDVISGLARGVDGEAHRGILENSWSLPENVFEAGQDVGDTRMWIEYLLSEGKLQSF